MSRNDGTPGVNLGGVTAIILFCLVLLGFVIETQLTQYVQTSLEFRQPYFIFYVVHSFFTIMFPTHFLYLTLTSKYSPRAIWNGLMYALRIHFPSASHGPLHAAFPRWKLLRLVLFLTAGMTVPSVCWFSAVSLSPLTDVTALWNTNAFFTYVVAVKMFKLEWEKRRLAAVILATAGAMAVVYGGSTSPDASEPSHTTTTSTHLPKITAGHSKALLGDILTLIAAILYGVYQVLYKVHASLPTDPDADLEGIDAPVSALYEPIADEVSDEDVHVRTSSISEDDMVYPPPFALYPNMLTSAIGICTLLILWIPIPILHVTGVREFHLPSDPRAIGAILGIALSGVMFNAGFMILLGVWGPILTSIGGLLTIVLVFLSDIIFGGAVETITIWSLIGCGSIVVAFGILVYDMSKRS
ncbi:Solute carrier family 35 member F3/F4 [Abortiporus biennis]